MADGMAEADDLGRLEAALDRIAVQAAAHQAAAAWSSGVSRMDAAAIKGRLDRVIGQLQDALADAGPPADASLLTDSLLADSLGEA